MRPAPIDALHREWCIIVANFVQRACIGGQCSQCINSEASHRNTPNPTTS